MTVFKAASAPRHRWRPLAAGALATIALFASGGCTAAGSSSSSGVGSNSAYWLVGVNDGYGNIYNYPAGNRPASSTRSEYLGSSSAQAHQNAPAAAQRLGISHVNPGIY